MGRERSGNKRLNLILDILDKTYRDKKMWQEVDYILKTDDTGVDTWDDFSKPFENLIIGILSQNTNDKNSTKAYLGLVKRFEISPVELAKAPRSEIKEAIKSGGLYNIKAKRIKKFASAVLEKYKGDLSSVVNLPREEARRKLIELPGIGIKTADVCLAYCSNCSIIPIDTNINRVAKRLGLCHSEATYEEVQNSLEEIISPEQRVRAHELLIRLGRDYCRAKSPLCRSCPVNTECACNGIHKKRLCVSAILKR